MENKINKLDNEKYEQGTRELNLNLNENKNIINNLSTEILEIKIKSDKVNID